MSLESTEIKFSESSMAEAQRIIAQFPEGKQKSAVIRILHLAQEEFGGWLSIPVIGLCGFYSQY